MRKKPAHMSRKQRTQARTADRRRKNGANGNHNGNGNGTSYSAPAHNGKDANGGSQQK
jgi:hypothetical protein